MEWGVVCVFTSGSSMPSQCLWSVSEERVRETQVFLIPDPWFLSLPRQDLTPAAISPFHLLQPGEESLTFIQTSLRFVMAITHITSTPRK